MSKESRCLGLVGGLGPGATVHYYRAIVAAHAAKGRAARMLIAHADVDRVLALAGANDLDALARYLAGVIADLKAGGAELAATVAITPHICAPQLARLSPLPFIDIVTEVSAAVRAKGLKRVALFSTRVTVETAMFGRLGDIDVVMPQPDEVETIHSTYVDIVAARQTAAQVDRLRELARTLVARDGVDAILLAGTDLSTVFDENNAGFPLLDCASVHITAIMRRLIDL
jgi:aspartate racemase